MPLGFIDMTASAGADYALPSKNFIVTSQLEVLAALHLEDEVMAQYGQANSDYEGLFGVSWAGKLILCFPDAAKHLHIYVVDGVCPWSPRPHVSPSRT